MAATAARAQASHPFKPIGIIADINIGQRAYQIPPGPGVEHVPYTNPSQNIPSSHMIPGFPQPHQSSPAIFQPGLNGPCPGTYVGQQSFVSHGQGNSPWTNHIHNTPSQGQPALKFTGHQLPIASTCGRQGEAPAFKLTADDNNRSLASTNLCGLQHEAALPQKRGQKDGRQDVLQQQGLNADAPSFKPQGIGAPSGDHTYDANNKRGLAQSGGGKQENRDLANEKTASIQNAETGGGNGLHGHNSGDNSQGPVVTAAQLNIGPSASRALHKRITSLRTENIPPCGITWRDGIQAYNHRLVPSQIEQGRGARDNDESNQDGATKKLSNQPLVVHSSNAPRERMPDRYTWRGT